MTGIEAAGVYVPRQRITAAEIRSGTGRFRARGIEEKAVPAADEDSLTMGFEAGRGALEAAESDGERIDWLGFASTTFPLDEHDLTPHLATMVGIPAPAEKHVFSGSTRAGTRAIWAALDALEASTGVSTALVIAADAPRGRHDDAIEHGGGAGAAALLLSATAPNRVTDRAEFSVPYPGTRFRTPNADGATSLEIGKYERQAFLEPIQGAYDELDRISDPDVVAIQAPDGDLSYRAAAELGLERETVRSSATVHNLGDLGAASVPLSIALGLAESPATILAIGYGSGAAADALVVESTRSTPAPTAISDAAGERIDYPTYLRQRGPLSSDPPEGGGAYVSIPTWQRAIPQRYRLEAGECRNCSELVFPPEGACHACGVRDGYHTTELSGEGTIEAVTSIARGGAPPEFIPLQSRSGEYSTVIVAFREGERTVSVPAMIASGTADDIAIGDPVEATIRRIYTQEGVTRYGFKVKRS